LLPSLKRATHDLHSQIERSVRFLEMGASVSDYRAYLLQLFGYLAPLESHLPSVCGDAPALELESRRKAALIVNDLVQLGWDEHEIDQIERCEHLPRVDGLQRALGCLYVLEGSTLGGRFIEHRLSQLHQDRLLGATSYLRCYGSKTGERWRAFGAALDAYATTPHEILGGARDTFSTLHAWLAGAQP
jgi:heme oxygenase